MAYARFGVLYRLVAIRTPFCEGLSRVARGKPSQNGVLVLDAESLAYAVTSAASVSRPRSAIAISRNLNF